MFARILRPGAAALTFALAGTACVHRPAMCSLACGEGLACVAGECLRAGTGPEVEALDKFGLYRARRIVVAPTDVVRLAPGDTDASAATPRVATLGRQRDAASMLLLRFSLDLPPEATLLAADIVLDRAPSLPSDPAPVALHAARIVEPWDPRWVAWGRAPRIEDARSPGTTIDDARTTVRIDVRSLVRRWRKHAPDDQGIALVADRASATGMAFALADGEGTGDREPVLPVRTLKDTPPTFHSAAEGLRDDGGEVPFPRGPRLELYVRP